MKTNEKWVASGFEPIANPQLIGVSGGDDTTGGDKKKGKDPVGGGGGQPPPLV